MKYCALGIFTVVPGVVVVGGGVVVSASLTIPALTYAAAMYDHIKVFWCSRAWHGSWTVLETAHLSGAVIGLHGGNWTCSASFHGALFRWKDIGATATDGSCAAAGQL